MGEDSRANDGSWKKIVLAKANNEWISNLKTEQADNEGSNTSLCSFEDQDCTNEDPINIVTVASSTPEDDTPNLRRRRKDQAPRGETTDERGVRLARMAAYAAHRLANETPEKRAARLKRMSEYAARRLATETTEQRERRLARMSAYAARRLAEESSEQRAARLARMSAYAARRQAQRKTSDDGKEHDHYYTSQTNDSVTNQS